MQGVVNAVHKINQNKLNGRPKIVGYTRSQIETEKHMAANGISPTMIEAVEGFFKLPPEHARIDGLHCFPVASVSQSLATKSYRGA